MKLWFLTYKLKKAMKNGEGEKAVEITYEVMHFIENHLVRITKKFSGLFLGPLLACATLWVEGMKQIADKTDLHTCELLLSKSAIITAENPVCRSGDCMRDPL